MERHPCVYILARSSHGTLYTGVTSNLIQRVHQHREETFCGYTKDYGIKRLVWFERHDTMDSAILREKRIKRWLRSWKYELIVAMNPTWRDLAEDFGFDPLPLGEGRRVPGQARDDEGAIAVLTPKPPVRHERTFGQCAIQQQAGTMIVPES